MFCVVPRKQEGKADSAAACHALRSIIPVLPATLLHSTLQELNFYPVLTCTQFMAAQIHNFQMSHLFYFSFQSLCGALGDASRSTWCSVEHSLGTSAINEHFGVLLTGTSYSMNALKVSKSVVSLKHRAAELLAT